MLIPMRGVLCLAKNWAGCQITRHPSLDPVFRKEVSPSRLPGELAVRATVNLCRSVDFMSDVLMNGQRFRTFNVLDDFTREALAIEATTLPAAKNHPGSWHGGAWRGFHSQRVSLRGAIRHSDSGNGVCLAKGPFWTFHRC